MRTRRVLLSLSLAMVASLAVGVASPAEAAPRSTATDRKFLVAAYTDLLGRAPTGSEVSTWQARLAAGTPRGRLASELARSQEWARVVVVDLYKTILDRTVDDKGRDYWAGRLVGGVRTADLAASLYGSDEFYARARGTTRNYVLSVYLKLFDRRPDVNGLEHWMARIDGGLSRTAMARQLYTSVEANGRRVDLLYRRFLARSPEPAGRAYWARRLVREDDLALAGLLVGSPEYYNRAQAR